MVDLGRNQSPLYFRKLAFAVVWPVFWYVNPDTRELVQVLEGPEQAVAHLFEKSKQDGAHKRGVEIASSKAKERTCVDSELPCRTLNLFRLAPTLNYLFF